MCYEFYFVQYSLLVFFVVRMTTYASVEVAVSSLRVHEGAEMWLGRKMELVEQRAAIKYPQEKWFTPTRIRNNMSAASG